MSGGNVGSAPSDLGLYFRSVERFADWIKYADAKAAGVLVLLGLGSVDLTSSAGRLVRADALPSWWGDIATVAFWIAVVMGGGTIVFVTRALFPSIRPIEPSIYFFGHVATKETVDEYLTEVDSLTIEGLRRSVASQAWELGRVALAKFRRTKIAYSFVVVFLAMYRSHGWLFPSQPEARRGSSG